MNALVADGDLVGAVAGLRGLAAAGVRTVALGTQHLDPALLSRHAAIRVVGPDPIADPGGFGAELAELAHDQGPFVAYPTREETIDALLAAPAAPGMLLPFPATGAVGTLRDKRRLTELAPAAGLRAPASLAEGQVRKLIGTEHPLPLIVKPSRRGPGVPEVTVAQTPEQLREQLLAFAPDERVLLQEAIGGDLHCIAVVVDREGRLVERFHQRVLRVWPRGAGAAATAVSIAPDEELCAASARMLAAAGYWGLAQLDFMVAADGARVIDVNPRFYISLALAGHCGVNLPAAWHRVATGADGGAPSAYRVGVGYRRLESDVSAAIHGDPRLLLDRPPRPVAGSVWSISDPLPAGGVVMRRLGLSVRKRVARPRPAAEDELRVTPAELDATLEAEWRALEARAAPAPYLCWDWLAAWRAAYRPRHAAAVRIAPADGGPPVALGLLERRRLGGWRFAGGEVTPIRGLLVADADAARAWAALAGALGSSHAWRSLDLAGVHGDATMLPGARLGETATWTVALPGTFDEFLAQRSSNQRSSHRRKLRRLDRDGGEVIALDAAERITGLEDFIRLHAMRARAKGERHPQMDARLLDLLRRLEGSEAIGLRIFALRAASRTAGVTVRLDRPDMRAAWFYNGGMDPEFERLSPGVVLELHSIRDAIERGYGVFDLGIGWWRYKQDLGGGEIPLWSGRAFAPGLRGLVPRTLGGAERAAREHSPAGVRSAYRRLRSRAAAGRTDAHQA